MPNEEIKCAKCRETVDPLAVFPNARGEGILCLSCYADTPEGRYVPTSDELSAMWGGTHRRNR